MNLKNQTLRNLAYGIVGLALAGCSGSSGSSPAAAAVPSLYSKYGGQATIQTVVDQAVTGLLADGTEAPYFGAVANGYPGHDSVDKLKSCLDLFFTVALGGPGTYAEGSHSTYRNPPANPGYYVCDDMMTAHADVASSYNNDGSAANGSVKITTAVFNQFVMDLGGILTSDGVTSDDVTTIANSLNSFSGQIIGTP